MSEKRIDTGVIQSVAASIDHLNNELLDTLEQSRATVVGLNSIWTGQAAEATISAYTAFERKYSQHYQEKLAEYSCFLRSIASENYEDAERLGRKLGDIIYDGAFDTI